MTASDQAKPQKGVMYRMGAVSKALEVALQVWSTQRQEYRLAQFGRASADAQEQFGRIEQLAQALLHGAGELLTLDSTPLDEVMAGLSDLDDPTDGHSPMIVPLTEAVQYHLGAEAVGMVSSAEQRIWQLLMLAQPLRPHWRASAFLQRVSRCYIFGFDPECVVMCRSVLEAEFAADITNEICRGELGGNRSPARQGDLAYGLVDRIAVARKIGRISEESSDKADTVRQAANDAIHRKPTVHGDSISIISDTIDIIHDLCDAGCGK